MSTAIQLLAHAYRDHSLDIPSTYDTTLEYPMNLAQGIMNEVILDLNKMGNFWFNRTKTSLTYSGGTYTYSFTTIGVNPARIEYVRKEATNYWGELKPYEYRQFLEQFRMSAVVTTQPQYYSKFNDTLELDSIPDQDYSIKVYHFKDMPQTTLTTDSYSTGVLLIPTEYEDLYRIGCYLYLGYKIGKWPYDEAYLGLKVKAQPFLVVTTNDSAIPQQFPAAF